MFQQSVCIGCGCTDSNACIDRKSGEPCHWVRHDPDAHIGVCSSCKSFVDKWDKGERGVAKNADKGSVIWAVFEHPADFPEGVMARKFIGELPTLDTITGEDVEGVRKEINSRYPNLYRIPRQKRDVASLVETWI